MWWLIALRGLRRGEVAGLRWCDVDLEHGTMTIAQQLTCVGYKILIGPPKSAASRRVIALDRHTVQALREHARRQRLERLAADRAWQGTGYVFTRVDGQPLHPSYLTQRFLKWCGRPGPGLVAARRGGVDRYTTFNPATAASNGLATDGFTFPVIRTRTDPFR
ncbi:tyrosine-type recombinase/integrase [Dactylosporangium sp. McL0621]|uniref:tyrosine-type recombinase/integrase n=1 Tax=Dactylosporangium sp. McL0621 TaxID=3415678 RepID=UPI003CFA2C15